MTRTEDGAAAGATDAQAQLAPALRSLAAQGALPAQIDRLRRLQGALAAHPACRALVLVGSYAKGCGDRISDLDLAAFTDEGATDAVLALGLAHIDRAEVLHDFGGLHAAGGAFRKLVFFDWSSCELHVLPLSSPFRLKRPFIVLWEAVPGVVAERVVDGEPVRHEDFDAYQYGDEGLLWELVDCIKWLRRGKTALARHHLRKLVARMDEAS